MVLFFFVVLEFSNQFDYYFPLSHIMVMNTAQREIKIKLVLKNFKSKQI